LLVVPTGCIGVCVSIGFVFILVFYGFEFLVFLQLLTLLLLLLEFLLPFLEGFLLYFNVECFEVLVAVVALLVGVVHDDKVVVEVVVVLAFGVDVLGREEVGHGD